MTAPRSGVLASARGRCVVCGPDSPGWVRVVDAGPPPRRTDRVWPCVHCNVPPVCRPIPIFHFPPYSGDTREDAA